MILKNILKDMFAVFGLEIRRLRFRPSVDLYAATRFMLLNDMISRLEGIQGSFVECGVAYGRSTSYMLMINHYYRLNRNILGFDSFDGYPVVSGEDLKSRNGSSIRAGDLKVDLAETLRFIGEVGLPSAWVDTHLSLVKGDIRQTAFNTETGNIALLTLELDLFEGTKSALEAFLPRMAKGGIILFLNSMDDDANFSGAREAVNVVLKERASDLMRHKYSGKYYLVV